MLGSLLMPTQVGQGLLHGQSTVLSACIRQSLLKYTFLCVVPTHIDLCSASKQLLVLYKVRA